MEHREGGRRPALDQSARRSGWRFPVGALLVALVALIGVGILSYPATASWFSQYNQSKLVGDYGHQVKNGTDPTAAQELTLAHAYNDALDSGAQVEANQRIPSGSGTSSNSRLDYWKMLAAVPTGVMARLRIPSIHADLPIYHGTSDDTLQHGVGHLEGTSLPVGGVGTHAVLTGHRGLASATLFTNLDQVSAGDTFTIEVFGEVLAYRVVTTQVVDPDQTESLRPQAGRDLVTLVTCTPLGINSQRILVTGERLLPTPRSAIRQTVSGVGFPWWIVWLSAAVAVAGIYVWRAGYRPAARRAARVGQTSGPTGSTRNRPESRNPSRGHPRLGQGPPM